MYQNKQDWIYVWNENRYVPIQQIISITKTQEQYVTGEKHIKQEGLIAYVYATKFWFSYIFILLTHGFRMKRIVNIFID